MNQRKIMYTLTFVLSIGLVITLVKVESAQMPIPLPTSDKGQIEPLPINEAKVQDLLLNGNMTSDKGQIHLLAFNQTIVSDEVLEKNMQAPPKRIDIPVNLRVVANEDKANTTTTSFVYEMNKDPDTHKTSAERTKVELRITAVKNNTTSGESTTVVYQTTTEKSKSSANNLVNHLNTWTSMAITVPITLSLFKLNRMFIFY